MSLIHKILSLLLMASCLHPAAFAQEKRSGYNDTPFLPNSKWRVHDSARPYPRITQGTPLFLAPPKDATVLFGGKDLSLFDTKGKKSWSVLDGYMEVNGTGNLSTKQSFGSCQLHLEWAAPSKVVGHAQGRGNSGVFLMSRYELQILDSYKNLAYADGQAAALYGQHPPLVNACMPPGEWQSYDIFFTAPVFKGKDLVSPARITALHNGVLVQNNVAFIGSTAHRRVAKYDAHGAAPLQLQDHGNPIRFRNIWIRPTPAAQAK